MVECESGWIQRARLFDFVLIDTWWNVNAEDNRRCVFASVCFNRYMVECEYIKQLFRQILYSVLIDTWWNVNSVKYPPISSLTFVLIDTWWNVNSLNYFKIQSKKNVLIDTWWNVNILPLCVSSNVSGFNRYMVECEYRNHNCGNPLFIVLIDTWWNVNY